MYKMVCIHACVDRRVYITKKAYGLLVL